MTRIICEACGRKIHFQDRTIHKLRHEKAARKKKHHPLNGADQGLKGSGKDPK